MRSYTTDTHCVSNKMALIFILFTLHFLIQLVSSEINSMPEINIVSPGIFGFSATASLSYNGPAVDTALQNLRRRFPQYRWKSNYVTDENITSCLALLENVQDLLSRWYYTQRKENDLSLFVTPGT
jgi:hypothetical protein